MLGCKVGLYKLRIRRAHVGCAIIAVLGSGRIDPGCEMSGYGTDGVQERSVWETAVRWREKHPAQEALSVDDPTHACYRVKENVDAVNVSLMAGYVHSQVAHEGWLGEPRRPVGPKQVKQELRCRHGLLGIRVQAERSSLQIDVHGGGIQHASDRLDPAPRAIHRQERRIL